MKNRLEGGRGRREMNMRDTCDDRDILYLDYINVNFFCDILQFCKMLCLKETGKLYIISLFLTTACEQLSQNKSLILKNSNEEIWIHCYLDCGDFII